MVRYTSVRPFVIHVNQLNRLVSALLTLCCDRRNNFPDETHFVYGHSRLESKIDSILFGRDANTGETWQVGRLTLYHMDVYRLSGVRDLDSIGYDACFTDQGAVVIEWAEKIMEALPEGTLFVVITYRDENRREILLTDNRERIDQILSAPRGT